MPNFIQALLYYIVGYTIEIIQVGSISEKFLLLLLLVGGLMASRIFLKKINNSSSSLKTKVYPTVVIPLAISLLIIFSWFLNIPSITALPIAPWILLFFLMEFYVINKFPSSLKTKIYYSIILILIIFSLLLFSLSLEHSNFFELKDFIFANVIPFTILFFFIELYMLATMPAKKNEEYLATYNTKPLILIAKLISFVLVLIFIFDPLILFLAKNHSNEKLCKLLIFHKKSSCACNIVINKKDDNLCKQLSNESQQCDYSARSRCYLEIGKLTEDIDVCLRGNKDGARHMNSCVIGVAGKTANLQFCEYLEGGDHFIKGLGGGKDVCVSEVERRISQIKKEANKKSSRIYDIAINTKDDILCEQLSNEPQQNSPRSVKSNCYMTIGKLTKDINVCLRGNKNGADYMASCVINVAVATKNLQFCEYLEGGDHFIKGLDRGIFEEVDESKDACVSKVKITIRMKK